MREGSVGAITNGELAIEIKNISVQLSDLKASLASAAASYVSNDVFNLRMREIDLRLDVLKAEMKDLNRRRWLQNTLSAILGVVLSLLVGFFLLNVGKR